MSVDTSKVRYVSLIRLEGGESILNIPYAEMSVDPDLIAGFVTAVITFANTPIRTIRKAAYDILIEVGETVLVLIVVDPVPDETPYRKRLRRILDSIEREHGEKLKRFEGDVRRYREFALKVICEFPFETPDLNLVPVRRKMGIQIPFRVGEVDEKMEMLEAFINGKRTVGEIMNLIELPDEEVVALLSALHRYRWIEYKRRLTPEDILVRRQCEDIELDRLRQQFGSPLDDVLTAFGSGKKIADVLNSLCYDQSAMWFLINKLVESGCLGVAESK